MLNEEKIVVFSNLRKIKNKNIVLVGGCFDILHYGHLIFLQKAKEHGNFLIIALESDKFIRERKKRGAVHNQQQRAEILSSINFVDLVVKLPYFSSDKEYTNLVKKIKPRIIAVSDKDPYLEEKKEQAKLVNGQLKIVCGLVEGFSSSMIIKNLSSS